MKLKDHVSELGDLILPSSHTGAVAAKSDSIPELEDMLRAMLTIRLVEEVISDLILSGEAKCPCHLGIGQEAIAVGIAKSLRASDRVFGAHRSHSHFLSMGGSPESILAEVLGKATGCSLGMGGSMHLYGKDFGFYGSVPIVAGTIPLAVGAALAAKKDGRGDIGVTYFGDGSSEEGVLHESLNLAAIYELPVLFVCENNLYSSHLDIAQRQPTDSIARFGDAHRIVTRVVDGNDIIEVCDAAEELIADVRAGKGPAFLEAVTYRWRGHVGPDENIDVGVRRSAADIAAWKGRDPIRRLYEGMIASDLSNQIAPLDEIEKVVRQRVDEAVEIARSAPYPAAEMNMNSVYAGPVR